MDGGGEEEMKGFGEERVGSRGTIGAVCEMQ